MAIYTFGESDTDLATGMPLSQGVFDARTDMEREWPYVSQYNPNAPDVALAAKLATDIIYVAGGQIELFHRSGNEDADKVWDEDPNPVYYQPIRMKAFWTPKAVEIGMKKSGPDAQLKNEVILSLDDVLQRFGERSIREGDAFRLYDHRSGLVNPEYYVVVNAAQTGMYRFQWLYLTCVVESIVGDITVLPEVDKAGRTIADYDEEGGYADAASR